MTDSASRLLRWSEEPQTPLLPGVTSAVRMGDQLSASLFLLEPGAVVPRHQHINEEFGQILGGSLTLTSGIETVHLQTGDAFLIPGDMPHSATAGPQGCRLLECYAPPRDPDPATRAEEK